MRVRTKLHSQVGSAWKQRPMVTTWSCRRWHATPQATLLDLASTTKSWPSTHTGFMRTTGSHAWHSIGPDRTPRFSSLRRGELKRLPVTFGTPPEQSWQLGLRAVQTPAQTLRVNAWLDGVQ